MQCASPTYAVDVGFWKSVIKGVGGTGSTADEPEAPDENDGDDEIDWDDYEDVDLSCDDECLLLAGHRYCPECHGTSE